MTSGHPQIKVELICIVFHNGNLRGTVPTEYSLYFHEKNRDIMRVLYPAETMTDAVYADDLLLLANTLTQAESPLHSQEQAVESICPNVNANKIEYICFKQKGAISTLSDNPWNWWKNSHTSAAISHELKVMLTYAW